MTVPLGGDPPSASFSHPHHCFLGSPQSLFQGPLWDRPELRQCSFPTTLSRARAPSGQAGWHRSIPARFCLETISPARVSDRVPCHVARQEDGLISHWDAARDLPGLWIQQQMEKYSSCKWFSLSLQNAPSSESGSCQLHSVPFSDPALRGVSGVRGPICCQNRPATSKAEFAGFATRPRLVMGALSPRAQGTRSIWCSPAPRLVSPPTPRPTIARPAGPAVGSSCLNYSRAQRETQVWNLSRGGRLGGSPACWSGRLCLSLA